MRDSANLHSATAELGGVCGVVVTFYPDNDIDNRIRSIASIVDKLIVIDNSADADVALTLQPAANCLGATLILNENNVGIATALNQGVATARREGAEWVVFFDQDSKIFEDFRRFILEIMLSYEGSKPLGIIGCNYVVENQAFVRSSAYSFKAEQQRLFVEVNSVITSGSFHKIELFERLGGFRDEYFIDMVDIEFCWRARMNGYAVVRSIKPLMRHSIGQLSEYKVLWRTTGTSNHQASRRYYSVRNSILLAKEYFFVYPIAATRLILSRCKSTILILAFEEQKMSKLGAMLRGFIDGVKGRTGEYLKM